jgi:hypothetical protein
MLTRRSQLFVNGWVFGPLADGIQKLAAGDCLVVEFNLHEARPSNGAEDFSGSEV